MKKLILATFVAAICGLSLGAQVYSPKLLQEGQPDPTDLKKFAAGIYAEAGAHSDREKAEAIWRFFLTDGRFVKPGFWYHIAGWTYEEPSGEVLDPIKLMNSYGFGLCYHIAPLLAAVFQAGGFESARCWFLTGHTVTEVFYDGSYHYFDSDMMGYNVAGSGPFAGKPVSSVRDLERDSGIILGKLDAPNRVKPGVVDNPWYPADVRASAMGDLAALFTTSSDNYLYPFTRYSPGHTMDFVLRPGETLTRYFAPEEPNLYYLPYKFDGKSWTEFPQEFAQYQIKTTDGPRSQKDNRQWTTGRIEYTPQSLPETDTIIIDMPSPYVIIDAQFTVTADLASQSSFLRMQTSTDGGNTWQPAGNLSGKHTGAWSTEPLVIVKSAHGRLTAVSGSYGYKVRITRSGYQTVHLQRLKLLSRIQVNPRALPAVHEGENHFQFSGLPPVERHVIDQSCAQMSMSGIDRISENGQVFYKPSTGIGEATYQLRLADRVLTGFSVGTRFFDINGGLVPDKLTAETRHTHVADSKGPASISWATSANGPFQEIWSFPQKLSWRDGDEIDRLLRWPELFREVSDLPAGTKVIYVKFKTAGPAFDSLRFSVNSRGTPPAGQIVINQVWQEDSIQARHQETLDAQVSEKRITFKAGQHIRNIAVSMSCKYAGR